MASLPRRNVPPPMSTTASGSNNAVMPVTSPAFSLATNNRSKSWGSLAGSLVVKSFIVTLRLSDCVALYLYYCAVCLLSYYVVPFLSYCVETGPSPARLEMRPRTQCCNQGSSCAGNVHTQRGVKQCCGTADDIRADCAMVNC